MKKLLFVFVIHWLTTGVGMAQPAEQRIKIAITPNHENWLYKKGEKAIFTVTVYKFGVPLKGAQLSYEIGPERMDPAKKGQVTAKDGSVVLEGGSLGEPGFLRCIVNLQDEDKPYRNLCTVGYDISSIVPVVKTPADFLDFWKSVKDSLAHIPIDAKKILLPERCTEKVNVYEVNLQNYGAARLYGILCIPKAPGKYPALLKVPGAGVRPYYGDVGTAEKGIITFEIGIHGIPVTMNENVYETLRIGALKDYFNYNLDSKDRYYYKRVYAGCVRANDFLCSLPEYDGTHLGVFGGSQGGALSIVTAALDKRVTALVSLFPALSDITGYLAGRAGGWPHLFDKYNLPYNNTKEKIETIAYYDVVNFAKQLTVPVKMTWGFNDETCPPTTFYAVYNSISAPKSAELYLDTGHWTYPEQTAKVLDWLLQQLKASQDK